VAGRVGASAARCGGEEGPLPLTSGARLAVSQGVGGV